MDRISYLQCKSSTEIKERKFTTNQRQTTKVNCLETLKIKEKTNMRKTEQILIRVTPDEKRQLKSFSQIQDKPFSELIRESFKHTMRQTLELSEQVK